MENPIEEKNEIRWGESINQISKYAIEALEKLRATDYENSQTARKIYEKFKELHPFTEIPETTFGQSLSVLIKDPKSRITKQEGRYGYFLTTFIEPADKTIPEGESDFSKGDISSDEYAVGSSKVTKREFLLYSLLEQWVSDQNYKVAPNVFNKRSNETWGNPDVAGIRVEEHLNRFDIEIITIEAKSSKDQWGNNWRKDIFEAVSHKRYSNRVYFCFAVKLGDKISDIADIKYYCELYRIGLILVEINPNLYTKFEEKNISDTGFSEEERNLIAISEKYPAPFDAVPLKYQREFCENTLEIKNVTELFGFGTG